MYRLAAASALSAQSVKLSGLAKAHLVVMFMFLSTSLAAFTGVLLDLRNPRVLRGHTPWQAGPLGQERLPWCLLHTVPSWELSLVMHVN